MINAVKDAGGEILNKMRNEDSQIQTNVISESAQDYKQKYMKKYGVSFTIPNLSIQSAVWYPKDPSYFIQIVNYVIPETDDKYEVHTHKIKENQESVESFENLFKDKIMGCSIRLSHTTEGLGSVDKQGEHFFIDEPRIDQLDMQFSLDGELFALYSKESKFIRLFSLSGKNTIKNLIK